MRRSFYVIIVGVTSAIALVFSAGTAFAGTSAGVYSTNGSTQALFVDRGEFLYACDLRSDGLRAVARALWTAGGVNRSAQVEDADGANNNCGGRVNYVNLSIPEGVRVSIVSCAKNGPNGGLLYCKSNDRGAVA